MAPTLPQADPWDAAREAMVARQLAARDIVDSRVLAAMRLVPRERFVLRGHETRAYSDAALPIAENQTISQPYIVALMAQLAALQPTDRVLEIGTGSGYAAAILSRLAAKVFTVERHPTLADAARGLLADLGYDNVEVLVGDGTLGLSRAAPFCAILASAAAPEVPKTWIEQLALGGRLVLPLRVDGNCHDLIRITRTDETTFRRESFGGVRFVPLIGEHGYAAGDD